MTELTKYKHEDSLNLISQKNPKLLLEIPSLNSITRTQPNARTKAKQPKIVGDTRHYPPANKE